MKRRKRLAWVFMFFCGGIYLLYFLMGGMYMKKCPPFSQSNQEYLEWFPYNQGDSIVFISESLLNRYYVDSYNVYYTDEYNSRAKCGCCEQEIEIWIRNVADSNRIHIFLENMKNPISCIGEHLSIGNYQTYTNEIVIQDTIIEGKKQAYINLKDSIFVIKNKGITTIKDKKRTWQLKEIIKKNTKRKIIETGC